MTHRPLRTAPIFLALIAPLGLLAGCGAGPTEDEVPLVLGPDDVRILGTSDSIAIVQDLEVLEDGSVWVLNSVEPLFVGFGPDGGVLAAHGRQGGGPEEFARPAGLVAGGPGGGAWTLDLSRHALVRISSPGEPRAEVSLRGGAIPAGSVMGGMSLMRTGQVRTARLGDAVVLPRRAGTGEFSAVSYWRTIWNADLVALDPETGDARTVVSLPDALDDVEAHFQALTPGFPPFPFWYRLWAACDGEDDEVRLHDFIRNQLRRFAADGTELDPIPLPPPPFTAATPRQFALANFDIIAAERAGAVTAGVGTMSAADSARLLDGATSRLDATPEQLAGILPQYVDMRCDDAGAVWLQPLDLEGGGMRGRTTWIRVSTDGTTREVRFPDRFDPYRFTDGRVWGVQRDELDVASVAWVDVGAGLRAGR